MSAQQITPELRDWIIAQAEAGHPPQAVLTAMQASGWEEGVALAAMEDVLHARAYGGLEALAKSGYYLPLDKSNVPELDNLPADGDTGNAPTF